MSSNACLTQHSFQSLVLSPAAVQTTPIADGVFYANKPIQAKGFQTGRQF